MERTQEPSVKTPRQDHRTRTPSSGEFKPVDIALQRFVGEVLTVAEASLPKSQFNAFKKLIWSAFHERMRPEIAKLLREHGHVGAVPLKDDNLDEKGGAL